MFGEWGVEGALIGSPHGFLEAFFQLRICETHFVPP